MILRLEAGTNLYQKTQKLLEIKAQMIMTFHKLDIV